MRLTFLYFASTNGSFLTPAFQQYIYTYNIALKIQDAGLKLKASKCRFVQPKVCYLGNIVSADGVEPDPAKIQAVIDYPVPTNVKELRQFWGLANYYRRFVQDYSRIASALFKLTQKTVHQSFNWTEQCTLAFEELKKKLTTPPILLSISTQFSFTVKHKAGRLNGNADGLSRTPSSATVAPQLAAAITETTVESSEPSLGKLRLKMSTWHLFLRQGYKESVDSEPCTQVLIPIDLRYTILKQLHNSAGHMGVKRTMERVTDGLTLTSILMDEVICHYGIPQQLHSDQGSNLNAECFPHLRDVLENSVIIPFSIKMTQHDINRIVASFGPFKFSGVQQEDPLGPMLFALVLQKLISTIDADGECLQLLLQAWYLDDGVLAAENCSKAKVLFTALVEVTEADLHVAVSLLRICGSYCKLAHLARTTPPSLSFESLKFFDEEVRRCFSTCIAADIPDDHWKQAQLSLSFGGLGFRSLSYHSCAAFISSLSSSGFGSASNRHLLSAISKFNALVSPTEAITVESVLSSPLSQHALCKKLDDHLFQSILMTSSPANKARLLSASAPHASSWLLVVPSLGCNSAGVAAHKAECRKHSSNDPKCQELGWVCVPLAVESYGNWGKEV
eukprot:Em0014g646a